MTITCPTCKHENVDGTEFCEVCGMEIGVSAAPGSPAPTPTPTPTDTIETLPPIPQPQPIPQTLPPSPNPFNPAVNTARLIAKQAGAPTVEFPLDGSNAIIGRFDSDTGPVDIDLEEFPGNETISRNHAEIYLERGSWKIQDLGSTNGVFIKPVSQTKFNARITTPETLNSGDEIAFGKVRFLFQSP